MSRINPLYIGVLLLVLSIFLIFRVAKADNELLKAKEDYKETSTICVELKELENIYADEKKIKESLEKILKTPVLKDAGFSSKIKNSGMEISSKSTDIKVLDIFMNRLLNGSYNITKLKIKRLNDTKVSIYAEISW